MKPIFLMVVGMMSGMGGFSQRVVVASDKMNVAYLGINNPISIVVENTPCKSLSATTNNGTLTRNNGCQYEWKPAAKGSATLKVFKNSASGKRLLDSIKYRVKLVDGAKAFVGGKANAGIKKAVLLLQIGLVVYLEGFDFDYAIVAKSFDIHILSGCKPKQTMHHTGARFTVEAINAFRKLKEGDVIFFDNIELSTTELSNPRGFYLQIE